MKTCTNLRINGSTYPLGIDDRSFRLTWRLPQAAAYAEVDRIQVRCASKPEALADAEARSFWDSGVVAAENPHALLYGGQGLEPGSRVYWTVRVWAKGAESPCEWAEPALWETGLGRQEKHWNGSKWIAHVVKSPRPAQLHCELFRRAFALPDKPITRARLYLATPGFAYVYLNEDPLEAVPCDPIPSQSDKRIYYRTFDLNYRLSSGRQVLGIRLASGCYSPVHPSVEHPHPVL